MMILQMFIFHHFLDFPTILTLVISLRSTKQVWAHERQKAKSAVQQAMSGCGQSPNRRGPLTTTVYIVSTSHGPVPYRI